MAKDPAFLFYSQDFFLGTAILTFEEKGKYITILCLMHQQGRMKEETIRFLIGSISDNLKSKFKIDENGFWFNERLELETFKRNKFTESRRNNGNKGGRPKNNKPNVKPIDKSKNNLMVIDMDNHMGNEIENENKDIIKDLYKCFFENEKFCSIWKDFTEMRKKIRAPMTVKAEKLILSKLESLSSSKLETAILIIENSIENSWKGVFPLNENNNGKFKQSGKKDHASTYPVFTGQEMGKF